MIFKKLQLLAFILISFNGIGQEIQGWSYKIITSSQLDQYGSLEFYLIDSSLLQLTKNKLNEIESIVLETKNYETGYNAKFNTFQSKKINKTLDFQIDTLVNKVDSFLLLIRSGDSTSIFKRIVPFTVLVSEHSKPSNLKVLKTKLALFSCQFPLKYQLGYPNALVVFERLEKCYLPKFYNKSIAKIKKRHSKRNLKKLVKQLNNSQKT